MRTAFEWFTEYLDTSGSVNVGKLWQCPAHEDSFPSLSVSEDDCGKVLIHCFAGCEWKEVLDALSLPASTLFQPHIWGPVKFYNQVEDKPLYSDFEWKQGDVASHNDFWYKYGSSFTSEEFHVYTPRVRMRRRRYSDRTKQCIWQELIGWRWVGSNGHLDLSTLPLYKTELVAEARVNGELVVLCESESSVDALVAAGVSATTWAGGAGKPQIKTLCQELEGCDVLYVADNDKAGLKCLAMLEDFLADVVGTWAVLVGEPGEDARDMLERGALSSLVGMKSP